MVSRVKSLLILAVIVVGFLALYKFVPPYLANYSFTEEMKSTVVRMHNSLKTDEEIRAAVFKSAQSQNLPITEEQIRVNRVGKTVTVSLSYQVHVDMPFYPVDLNFAPAASNTLP